MKPQSLEVVLREHALTRGMSEEHLRFLTGCAQEARYEKGSYLFRVGEESNALYLVRHGRIALEIPVPGRGVVAIESLGPGDVAGWSALSPPFRWHVDGVARETAVAVVLDGRCIREKCEGDPALGYQLTQRLLALVARRLAHSRLQLLDVYRPSP